MAESHDTEVWKPVVGYEGLYEVSDLGRIRALDRRVRQKNKYGYFSEVLYRGRPLKPHCDRYCRVILNKNGKPKTHLVHRVVLEAFVGPCPEGMEARHFPSSDVQDNRLSNLSWSTHKENESDKVQHGTTLWGDRSGTAKITEEDARSVFDLRKKGLTFKRIGEIIGITGAHAAGIYRGTYWPHLRSLRSGR